MAYIPPDPTLAALRKSCLSSFARFCNIFQGEDWFEDGVHQDLCDFIQHNIEKALLAGDTSAKIMVVMGRGTLKTTFCTKLLPIWLTLPKEHDPWTRYDCPGFRTLIATNTYTNAKNKLADIKGMFDREDAFKAMFPDLLNNTGKGWTAESLTVNRKRYWPEATFTPAGVGTRLIGAHYNIIIEDDTTAPDESDLKMDILTPSIETIEKAVGWHKQGVPLMIRGNAFNLRLIVSTRWSEFDLVNFIKEEGHGWNVFDMPTEKEDGSPNFPKVHKPKVLEEIKKDVGPYIWSCLYQNKPIDQAMKVFQDQWIHYVEPGEVPDEGYYSVAIDPAISEKDEACETAVTRVKHVMKNGRHPFQYWDRAVHGRMNPADQVKACLDLVEEDPEHTKALIVEATAWQDALRFYLTDEMIRRELKVPIIAFRSRASKDIRIQGLVPYFSGHRLFLVRGISTRVEKQLRQYPFGRLVDILDSFAMHYKALKNERHIPRPKKISKSYDPFSWDNIIKEIEEKQMSEGRRPRPGAMQDSYELALGVDSGFEDAPFEFNFLKEDY
mgnify:CR=1 FL=1|tara:strand:+ start:2222 stop:3880 length:1659 start_codon:yes stop_codon:yes gene_type:complete